MAVFTVSLSRYVCWGLELTLHTLGMDWRTLVPPKLAEQRNGHPGSTFLMVTQHGLEESIQPPEPQGASYM